MTTAKQIIDDIRLRLKDLEKRQFTDTMALRCVNEAIEAIVEDNGGLIETRTTNSVDGQMSYGLDSDIKSIEQVWYDGENVERMDYNEMFDEHVADSEDVSEGTPDYYAVRMYGTAGAKYLFLYPVPSQSSKVIRIDAKIYYPAVLSTTMTNEIGMPEELVKAVRDRATYYAAREIGNFDLMQIWKFESDETKMNGRPTKNIHRHGMSQKI